MSERNGGEGGGESNVGKTWAQAVIPSPGPPVVRVKGQMTKLAAASLTKNLSGLD